MSGRGSVGPLALAAGAAVLAAFAVWFLGGDRPSVPTAPAPAPAPTPLPPSAARPEAAPPPGPRRPRPSPPPQEPAEPLPAPLLPGAEPWARLRLLDARTGAPVPAAADPSVVFTVSRNGRPVRLPQKVHPLPGDVLAVFPSPGEADRPGGPTFLSEEEIRGGRYEVLAHGFATRSGLRRSEIEGEREFPLEPVAPAVRGVLVAAPDLEKGIVRAEILPAEGVRVVFDFTVRGPSLPRALGPFEIFDLPDGKWNLRIWVSLPGGDRGHVTRTFEKAGGPVDLGTIEVPAPATIRARVVGMDGTGMLDDGLTVRRAGEAEGARGRGPDAEGWVEFRGLEPDVDYLVSSSIEGVEQTVRTPAGGTRVVSVELRWEVRGVRCRIRFTVGGQDPVQWGAIFEGPVLDADVWRRDGFLEQEMAPGEYLFGILAQPVGSTVMKRVFARFKVPDQATWEPVIDMKESP